MGKQTAVLLVTDSMFCVERMLGRCAAGEAHCDLFARVRKLVEGREAPTLIVHVYSHAGKESCRWNVEADVAAGIALERDILKEALETLI